ncbi:MAG: enoyl-CoA hydratase [Rhodospirillaceae bacterium]|jgi:enoyl-CoA hydratase/carnithine racemase|nr:enoyl-CoA hydratase [Rhodospirillaceae bacterium]|tara:strand:- start:118 stop:906 length:789 start_codon:yes stop_codon:yes gene_type:complete
MSEGKIIAKRDGHVGRVIFDNVAKHNAVSRAMWDQLADTMEAYDADDEVRVVVLEGAGDRAFVSGADISQFENEHANLDATKAYGQSVGRGYGAVQNSVKPTIAKIRGYCFGGGVGIAICTDIRICSDNSNFCIPAAKLGVGYGPDNTKVLVDLVGPSFAKEIFYTGRRFDAEEARMMGLVNRVVQFDDLDDYVQGYTDMMTSNAPLSLRATNLIVNELVKDESQRDKAKCAQLVEDCAGSDDLKEGRRAFMEKRKPEFIGR